MCGCECCIYAKIIHSSLSSQNDHYLRKLKYKSCNAKKRRFDKMTNRIFKTYKHSVMPHGKHIPKTASGMTMATMCAYPSSTYALPH